MKHIYTFIVYAKESPKKISGILGEIDLHAIHILLVGGTTLPQEEFVGSSSKAAKWYQSYLEENGVIATLAHSTGKTLWFEVNCEKTDMSEFTYFHEVSSSDTDTIAWRTFWYPCTDGTQNECLGLAIMNRETYISGLSLESMFQTILSA